MEDEGEGSMREGKGEYERVNQIVFHSLSFLMFC